MAAVVLKPTVEDLSQEYVLVQAWKKASAYIRYHNWFSDTLELDRVAANLPDFIAELSTGIASGEIRASQPLRIVPAPKSQPWRVDQAGNWRPESPIRTASKIRPLAHVTLRDQVITTAMMLCLADRAETAQGDPTTPLDSDEIRGVTSYGNRLFCDNNNGLLRHRWGSAKLYRGFYQDYQTFLARPEAVAEEAVADGLKIVILQSDLRQFYDRVSHSLFLKGINNLRADGDDDAFFELVGAFMQWRWDAADRDEVSIYAKQAGIADFSRLSLPQGLVASGFFANTTLLDFDLLVRRSFNSQISLGIQLIDSARYVDDLRMVLKCDDSLSLVQIEQAV